MENSKQWLYHILPHADWQAARQVGVYVPSSLKAEGFIHCSRLDQVIRSANVHFPNRDDLVVLVIDPKKIEAALRWEDLSDAGQRFPHLYGPLNLDAVVGSLVLGRDATGNFIFPES